MIKNAESVRQFFRDTKVKEVMAGRVKTLHEDDELSKAQAIFISDRVFYIPVVDPNKKLVGLMSHKYLYRTQSPRKFVEGDVVYEPGFLVEGDSYYDKETLDSYFLRGMMQRNPYTMGPEDSLADAIVTMAMKNLGCIVIVDKDLRVVGMLTDREILFYTATILQE